MLGLTQSLSMGGVPVPVVHGSEFMRHNVRKTYPASVLRTGNRTANCAPTCTAAEAKEFATGSRNQDRHARFLASMVKINEVAGGEPRKIRRAMARSLAKREVS